MSRVIFDNQPIAPQPNTGRADVACFLGLARIKSSISGPSVALPVLTSALSGWLASLGYNSTAIASLTNVPLPIESFSAFGSLFDDGSTGSGFGTDYLAAAVRSFFAQGGRKCYVVRCADPLTPADDAAARNAKRALVLLDSSYDPADATTWGGIGALGMLEEVSFVALPDLPALCAADRVGAVGQMATVPMGPQTFAECSPAEIVPRQYRTFAMPAPRLDAASYAQWAAAAGSVVDFLSSGHLRHQLNLREMQLVAAMPIPLEIDPATAAELDPAAPASSGALAADVHSVLDLYLPETPYPGRNGLSSSFLQLAYPWLRTGGSSILLEGLEPGDGALIGLLARNALTRGTFTSATKIVPAEVYDVAPELPRQETLSPAAPIAWGQGLDRPLIERLSLFGHTPLGLRLLSDVTAYNGESYRSASVTRLVATLCRTARRAGETAAFQNNGPALWASISRSVETLLTRLWNLGALDGASAAQAFSVRCDRTTMTQNDIDNGRTIAQVTFTPAALLETLRITLAIETSGASARETDASKGTFSPQDAFTASFAEAS